MKSIQPLFSHVISETVGQIKCVGVGVFGQVCVFIRYVQETQRNGAHHITAWLDECISQVYNSHWSSIFFESNVIFFHSSIPDLVFVLTRFSPSEPQYDLQFYLCTTQKNKPRQCLFCLNCCYKAQFLVPEKGLNVKWIGWLQCGSLTLPLLM